MVAKPKSQPTVEERTGPPESTLKRWKRNGIRPVGRSALMPMDLFVERCRPLLGTGRPADVAMLKLAGEQQVGTAGLPDTLIRLTCSTEGRPDSTGPHAAYNAVADLRKTTEGDRVARNLKMSFLVDGPASKDLAETQADNVLTAVSLAMRGEIVHGEMADDVAQLYENGAARLLGEDPELASDHAVLIAQVGLDALGDIRQRIIEWLTRASVDEMVDAVRVAAALDEVIQLVGGRDERRDEEKWRGIGRMAPQVGVDPQRVVASLELFEALRSGALGPPAPKLIEP
jgi:hypothetical protein